MTQTTSDGEWSDFSDEQLIEHEQYLYDREVAGEDLWFERDQVLNEMNRRGLCKSKKNSNDRPDTS